MYPVRHSSRLFLRSPVGLRLARTAFHDRSRLPRRFENMSVDTDSPCRFHVLRAIVEKQRLLRHAPQLPQTVAIDDRIGLGAACLARPDFYVELVQPVELAAENFQ